MITAVIPAFNEAETVGDIIQRTKPHVNKIIVVDDGSWDNTSSICQGKGAIVLKHLLNIGTGGAVMTGIKYVRQHFPESHVIVLDADGQHDPEDIPKFLDIEGDIIIGTRLGCIEGLEFSKQALNKIASSICSLFAGIPIEDSESGFRFYRSHVVKEISCKNFDYGWASENIINLAKKGFKISFIPIKTVWGIPSRMGQSRRGLVYGLKHFLRLLRA